MARRILAAALLASLALAAWGTVPAAAQEGGADASASASAAQAYPAGGEPPEPPPDYAFDDGVVYVSGDEAISCREFVRYFDQGYDEYGDQEQAQRVLEKCEQAGSPGATDIPPEVRAEIRREAVGGALPETGGISALPAAAGVLLSAAGLLALVCRG